MELSQIPSQPHHCRCAQKHFTARELEVLQLIAAGCTNSETAAQLHISTHTVAREVAIMLHRAGAPNRAALLALAFQGGNLRPGDLRPELTGRRCVWPRRLAI